jgi:hypothetical protein
VEAVLGEGEEEEAEEGDEDGEGEAEGLPGGDVVEHVGDDEEGERHDGEPLVVGEELEEAAFEHAGRGHEEPVGGVDDLHVALVVEAPNLREEGPVGVDDALDVLPERADDHGVGHDERQRMVKLHLIVDALEVAVAQHDSSAGVVGCKGSHVQHVAVEDQQRLAVGL